MSDNRPSRPTPADMLEEIVLDSPNDDPAKTHREEDSALWSMVYYLWAFSSGMTQHASDSKESQALLLIKEELKRFMDWDSVNNDRVKWYE